MSKPRDSVTMYNPKVFYDTRMLPCGCHVPWEPQWFENLRRIGLEGAKPGEEPMTEEGVLRELAEKHVCPLKS